MKNLFTLPTLLSSFYAFFFVVAMTAAGCSAGSLAGPDAPQQAAETPSITVEESSIEAPRNNTGNGGGSTTPDAGRNNIGEE